MPLLFHVQRLFPPDLVAMLSPVDLSMDMKSVGKSSQRLELVCCGCPSYKRRHDALIAPDDHVSAHSPQGAYTPHVPCPRQVDVADDIVLKTLEEGVG
jgi:hypothetical protein